MATPALQLQAMRHLDENWDGYGAAAPKAHIIDLGLAFVTFLEGLLRVRSSAPCVMNVAPTRTGGILVEWADAATQHEVEFNTDGSFSFLHLNTATGQISTLNSCLE
jgi:hypothetical protein